MVICQNGRAKSETMKWIAAKIIFDHENTQMATELIADAFYSLGLKGVEIEDKDLEPEEAWGKGLAVDLYRMPLSGFFRIRRKRPAS